MTQPQPSRTSPFVERLQSLSGSWQDINGMPVLTGLANEHVYADRLGLADLSCLTRFGVKGAKAAVWLTQQGILLPDRPNSWCALPQGGIVARLGVNEFLIEDSIQSQVAPQLAEACQYPPAQVYPVLRQDAALALCGSRVNDLLCQTCNVNFAALCLDDRPIVLTSLIGIAVLIIPGERAGVPFYRLWCDSTFGHYLWDTLLPIAEELGGGAIGPFTHSPTHGDSLCPPKPPNNF